MRHSLAFSSLALIAAVLFASGGVAHEAGIVVDGIVGDGEYANQYTDQTLNLTLYWTIDTEEGLIHLALASPEKGWVGIGFYAADGQSRDWNIGAFHDEDGDTHVLDAFQGAGVEVAQSDEFLGGSDDVLEKAAAQAEQGTTLEFTRKLDTSDVFDVSLKPGLQGTMLAFSPEDEYERFDQESLTSVNVDFFTGEVTSGTVN